MDYIDIIEKSIYNIDSKICGIIDDYRVLQEPQAQGLEYKSVKVVITEDIDEKISHNIFYTAITRTSNEACECRKLRT